MRKTNYKLLGPLIQGGHRDTISSANDEKGAASQVDLADAQSWEEGLLSDSCQ